MLQKFFYGYFAFIKQSDYLPVCIAGVLAVVVTVERGRKLGQGNTARRHKRARFLFLAFRSARLFTGGAYGLFGVVRSEHKLAGSALFGVKLLLHFLFLSQRHKPTAAIAKLKAYKSACAKEHAAML